MVVQLKDLQNSTKREESCLVHNAKKLVLIKWTKFKLNLFMSVIKMFPVVKDLGHALDFSTF